MIRHIYGNDNIMDPASDPFGDNAGRIIRFAQRPFVPMNETWETSGFADEGFIYVPTHCATNSGCKVMVVMHGCGGKGDNILLKNGFAHMGASNNIIMIAP